MSSGFSVKNWARPVVGRNEETNRLGLRFFTSQDICFTAVSVGLYMCVYKILK